MTRAIRLNWSVHIVCIDCNTTFEVDSDPSIDRVGSKQKNKAILLIVPNECPECHNIRIVQEGSQ